MQARFKPIPPKEDNEKKLEPEDVDMSELEPVNPDLPMTEATPLPAEVDRYAPRSKKDIIALSWFIYA